MRARLFVEASPASSKVQTGLGGGGVARAGFVGRTRTSSGKARTRIAPRTSYSPTPSITLFVPFAEATEARKALSDTKSDRDRVKAQLEDLTKKLERDYLGRDYEFLPLAESCFSLENKEYGRHHGRRRQRTALLTWRRHIAFGMGPLGTCTRCACSTRWSSARPAAAATRAWGTCAAVRWPEAGPGLTWGPASGALPTAVARLSSWQGWASPNEYKTMKYTGGQKCWNGPERSTEVRRGCTKSSMGAASCLEPPARVPPLVSSRAGATGVRSGDQGAQRHRASQVRVRRRAGHPSGMLAAAAALAAASRRRQPRARRTVIQRFSHYPYSYT